MRYFLRDTIVFHFFFLLLSPGPAISTLFPYTTLFRSGHVGTILQTAGGDLDRVYACNVRGVFNVSKVFVPSMLQRRSDRKSTRLNSSHGYISYAVFCSKKKKPTNDECHRVQEKTKQTD